MRRRIASAPLLGMLLALAGLPGPLAAQEWLSQVYLVSARLEADAETLKHPDRRAVSLIVPAAIPNAEACVDASASNAVEQGRSRVRVLISRAGDDGEQTGLRSLEFEWRQDDPPLLRSRCQDAGSLMAGDLVEFRFRFYDMPALELHRRGQRISTLPVLTVSGWVRQGPFPL